MGLGQRGTHVPAACEHAWQSHRAQRLVPSHHPRAAPLLRARSFLPDKAIDLIDEAGSRVRLRHIQLPEEARDLDKELKQVCVCGRGGGRGGSACARCHGSRGMRRF